MNKTLLLFDIDGTLILTGGAGTRAMSRAFEASYGASDMLRHVGVAGRTDRIIMADALRLIDRPLLEDTLPAFCDLYCTMLAEELARNGTGGKGVLPGVRPLLDALADREDVTLALLTGNFRQSAEIKLRHFDLWRYFRWGVYGEEALERHHLLPIALDRCREHADVFDPSDIIIIGDTPNDIDCARRGGARVIAVATGHYDLAALDRHRPDALFTDLGDTAAVLASIQDVPNSRQRQ